MSIEDPSRGSPKSAQLMSSGSNPTPCAVSTEVPSSSSQVEGLAEVETEVTCGAGR